MRYVFGFAATLGTIGLFAVPAHAQTSSGSNYVSGSLGVTFPQDATTSLGVRARLNNGMSASLAVGHAFGPIRGEIEGFWRQNDVRDARGFGFTIPGQGNVSAYGAMANVYLDPAFHVGPLKPYVGGGIGLSDFHAYNVSSVGTPFGLPFTGLGPVNGTKLGYAYQGMAGVGIAASRFATLTIGYRYWATPSVRLRIADYGRVRVNGLQQHGAEVGLRFAF